MLPNEIYFARHVEAEHNLQGLIGADDTDITARGRLQAMQLGSFLAGQNVGVVASSDRSRTRMTWDIAQAAGEIHSEGRVTSDCFNEVDMGSLAGVPASVAFTPEIEEQAMREDRDFVHPGGESVNQAAQRFMDGLKKYDGIGIIISHSFAIKSLIGARLDWSRQQIRSFKLANGELIAFDPYHPREPVRLFKPETE